jgi:hypothetical protein
VNLADPFATPFLISLSFSKIEKDCYYCTDSKKKSMPQILEMITKGKFSLILDMYTITRLKSI